MKKGIVAVVAEDGGAEVIAVAEEVEISRTAEAEAGEAAIVSGETSVAEVVDAVAPAAGEIVAVEEAAEAGAKEVVAGTVEESAAKIRCRLDLC